MSSVTRQKIRQAVEPITAALNLCNTLTEFARDIYNAGDPEDKKKILPILIEHMEYWQKLHKRLTGDKSKK